MQDQDIAKIEQASREELLALWQKIFKTPPPKSISQPLLKAVLAFEIQAKRTGGLDRVTRQAIKRERTKPMKGQSCVRKAATLKPGSRLMREWNGITHHVEVTDGGYLWQARSYRSLSSIAQAITGTHWSGPRFFGLNKQEG